MLEMLKQLDTEWFLSINNGWQNAFMDWLCPWLRQPKTWIPLYVLAVFFSWKKFNKNAIWVVLGAALLVLICDQFSANLVKNTFERLRPCNDPALKNQVHLLVGCGGGYSFMSAHATNHFGIAVFFSVIFKQWYPKLIWFALFWAACISLSQVYVGVHYPFDIICGALTGCLFGLIMSFVVNKWLNNKIYKL